MRAEEEKKGRGKEEKKRKQEEKLGIKSKKKKKKKTRSPCASFSSAQSSFLDRSEIRYLEESTLYLLLFSCKFFSMNKVSDFQELKIYPHPLFAILPKSSGSPEDIFSRAIHSAIKQNGVMCCVRKFIIITSFIESGR